MVFNYFTLFTALALSASAIFYSVTGLALIFAGAFIPVVIMGTILEVSKLVTAVWLHRNWNVAVWWLKMYLSLAVIILMFITSMGIFGYLSKSHIEQATASQDQVAKIQSIEEHLILSTSKMGRWRKNLDGLVNGSNIRVDTVLAREQNELDIVYSRIEAEQAKIQKAGDSDIALQTQRLNQAAARKESAIKALGKNPSRKAISRLQSQELSVASRAQKEIIKIQASTKELLSKVEPKYTNQLLEINERISGLKNQSGDSLETIETKIVSLETKLSAEQKVIDKLSDDKAILQSRTRQLEAEVGPIRYIAEFIYTDNTSKSILEEAVRWVIVIIIVVFDPLAVLLLIATQYSFEERKKELELKKVIHDEVVEEVDHVIHDTSAFKDWPLMEEDDILPKIKDEDIPPMPPVKPPKDKLDIDYTKPDLDVEAPEFTMTTESFEPHVWPDTVLDDSVKHFEAQVNDIENWEDQIQPLKEEDDVETNNKESTEEIPSNVWLTKITDGYVNYNGKSYRIQALLEAHPELKLDFKSKVNFGDKFPKVASLGEFFIKSNEQPTRLYRFNGVKSWNQIDKNVLETSAYATQYIEKLIDLIDKNEYSPELLNGIEQKCIEEILTRSK